MRCGASVVVAFLVVVGYGGGFGAEMVEWLLLLLINYYNDSRRAI